MIAPEEIGKILRDAREAKGYKSRISFAETRGIRGHITAEGIRKIEQGERIPRIPMLRRISKKLGLEEGRIRELENAALRKNVQRAVKQAGNPSAPVQFQIQGVPMRVNTSSPKKELEAFVREVVDELSGIVEKYGVMDEDVDHFRRHARHVLLKQIP